MFESINMTVVFILGWGSVALIGFIIYKFVRHLLCWAKGMRL